MSSSGPFASTFETMKIGEYIRWSREAAQIVREQNLTCSQAVGQVLADRKVTSYERHLLEQKTLQNLMLGIEA